MWASWWYTKPRRLEDKIFTICCNYLWFLHLMPYCTKYRSSFVYIEATVKDSRRGSCSHKAKGDAICLWLISHIVLLNKFKSVWDKPHTACLETNAKLMANVKVFHSKDPVSGRKKKTTAFVNISGGTEFKHLLCRRNFARNTQIHV